MLAELTRREKEENIKPDPDIDIYQKVRKEITIEVPYIIYVGCFRINLSLKKIRIRVRLLFVRPLGPLL